MLPNGHALIQDHNGLLTLKTDATLGQFNAQGIFIDGLNKPRP
jgi:hypothetical protein